MPEIITRQEARDRDLRKYMTGRPCKHDHVAERRTDTGNCIECQWLAGEESFTAAQTGAGGFSRMNPLPDTFLSNTKRMLHQAAS